MMKVQILVLQRGGGGGGLIRICSNFSILKTLIKNNLRNSDPKVFQIICAVRRSNFQENFLKTRIHLAQGRI